MNGKYLSRQPNFMRANFDLYEWICLFCVINCFYP